MEFPTQSSPYLPVSNNVHGLMVKVMLGLIPGAMLLLWFFGWGVIFNLVIATATAIAAEAAMLAMRGRPVRATLYDGSAVLTGLLLGLALPPLAPWWIPFIGSAFAIIVAKQLYGGIGYNPFNPAMVGYVVLIISFPLQMTLWAPPTGIEGETLAFVDTIKLILEGQIFVVQTALTKPQLKPCTQVLLVALGQQLVVGRKKRYLGGIVVKNSHPVREKENTKCEMIQSLAKAALSNVELYVASGR